MNPVDLALVAGGAAVGAVLRHLVGIFATRTFGMDFPWGTLTVNVVGSFLMGLLFASLMRAELAGLAHQARLVAATGFLGGFTTFSAFSLEIVLLYERGAMALAAAYVLASLVLGIAALAAGLAIVRSLPT